MVVKVFLKALHSSDSQAWTNGSLVSLAAAHGHADIFKLWHTSGVRLDYRDDLGRTALHAAAFENHPTVIPLLLDLGLKIDVIDDKKFSPLDCAASAGKTAAVQSLVELGADLNLNTNECRTAPLYSAVNEGHPSSASYLPRRGARSDASAIGGWTSLHAAADRGNRRMVEMLCSEAIDIDVALDEEDGRSPLALAASKGHLEIVEILYAKGARIDSTNSAAQTTAENALIEGHTRTMSFLLRCLPLVDREVLATFMMDNAVMDGNFEAVRALLASGGSVDRDWGGTTLLMTAITSNNPELAGVILRLSADTAARDSSGWLALHHAVVANDDTVFELVLDRTNDIDGADSDGLRALDFALDGGAFHKAELLLNKGAKPENEAIPRRLVTAIVGKAEALISLLSTTANVNQPIHNGVPPLLPATHCGTVRMIRDLVSAGADLQATDLNECTTLHVAVSVRRQEVIAELLQLRADPNARMVYNQIPLMLATIVQCRKTFELLYHGTTNSLEGDMFTQARGNAPRGPRLLIPEERIWVQDPIAHVLSTLHESNSQSWLEWNALQPALLSVLLAKGVDGSLAVSLVQLMATSPNLELLENDAGLLRHSLLLCYDCNGMPVEPAHICCVCDDRILCHDCLETGRICPGHSFLDVAGQVWQPNEGDPGIYVDDRGQCVREFLDEVLRGYRY